jgi:hypothetical protein
MHAAAGTTAPEAQLRSLIDRFAPEDRKLMRSVRAALRKRLPTANELAYDYSSQVIIAYTPTEGPIDGIVSLAIRSDGVRLYFIQGVQLPDPKTLLLGSGRQTRFVRIESAGQLADPDVEALIAAAIDQATVALPSTGRGRLVMRSAGATRRPRRKPTT